MKFSTGLLEDGLFPRGSLDNKARHPAHGAEVQNFETEAVPCPKLFPGHKQLLVTIWLLGKENACL